VKLLLKRLAKVKLKKMEGHIYILSAPSGTGKTTIGEKLIREISFLEKVITATTRQPREGEKNGVDYYFYTEEEFLTKLKKGEFLEWAKVYKYYYGTPKAEVKRILSQGKDALLIIDIQGAIKVKEIIPSAILIFLLPPSLEELKRRLINRAEKEWELRFKWAVEKELPCVKVSDYVVINDNLNKAVKEVASIIISNRLRTSYFLSKNLSLLSDEKIKEIIKNGKCLFLNKSVK
jgi:guanylate kinase